MSLNPWELPRQVAMQLANCKWPDPNAASGYSPILTGGVTISEDDEGNFLPTEMFPDEPAATPALPFAVVREAVVVYDPEVEGLIASARIHCRITAGAGGIAASNVGGASTHGQDSLVGGPLGPDGLGGSIGKGLDDIWPEIIAQAFNGGAHLSERNYGYDGWVDQASQVDNTDGAQIMTREFDIVAVNALSARFYHPLYLCTALITPGGIYANWFSPPNRFDSLPNPSQYYYGANMTWWYKSGSTAPSAPGAPGCIDAAAYINNANSLEGNPGSGVWSFSGWAMYDDRMPGPVAGPDAFTRYSLPINFTLTVP